MANNAALRRLTKEYINIQKSPPAYLFARPLEKNILEWHYVLKGPPDTPYYGGEYHGKLVFPSDYPFKPPSIRMITPNGRFQVDTRLCLSMSDFHPGTWNPSWSVATILNGLLSFMSQDESTTGSINTSYHDRQLLALRSHGFNMSNPKFREIFPELVAPAQVPLHIAFPNAPVTEMPPTPVITTVHSTVTTGAGVRTAAAAAVGAVDGAGAQRRHRGGGDQGVIAAPGGTGAHRAGTGATAGAGGAVAVRQDSLFSWSRWHKWLAIFLLFAYLLIAKTINRAASSSGHVN
ncbi:Ubiquitin-conjugating enzyme E2 6 [Podila epigama]|nr:Ubiquitin-conjugating enzyme E2 6 [Podila epigama]